LSASNLHALQTDLVGVIRRAHGPGEDRPVALPAPVAAAPLAAAPAAPPTAKLVPPPPPPAQVTEPAPAPRTEPAEATPSSAPRAEMTSERAQAERGPSLLEVQPTLGLLHRTFEVSSGSGAAPTLRSTSVPTSAQPGIYLALYPLRSSEGLF